MATTTATAIATPTATSTTKSTTTTAICKINSAPRLSSNINVASGLFQGGFKPESNTLCTAAAIEEAGENAIQVNAGDKSASAMC